MSQAPQSNDAMAASGEGGDIGMGGEPTRGRVATQALAGVISVCALLLAFSGGAAWARSARRIRPVGVSASFVAVGAEVDAYGTLRAGGGRGVGSPSHWRAVLEQQVGSRWVRHASARLARHGGLGGFSLRWTGARPGQREKMRVEIVSGRRVIARSGAHAVRSSSPVSVSSTLRRSTAAPAASEVLSVSGRSGGAMVVVLGRGAPAAYIGAALVIDPSAKVPDGLLGVVTAVSHLHGGSVRVATRPGTLEDAYSSFDAHLNGELGQLVAGASTASTRAHAAADLGVLDPSSFSCDDPGVDASVTHHIDLSKMRVSANVAIPSPSDGYYGPGVELALYGRPKLEFGLTFTGSQSCKAEVVAKIPIPDTPGLMLEIGPDFTLSATGAVGIKFQWEPWLFYGFGRFRGGPNWDSHQFKNGGKVNFTGAAGLTLSLALDAGLSLDGKVGVRGTIGPEVTGQLSEQTSPPQSCLTVDADFAASLSVFAKAFFADWSFTLGSVKFGEMQLFPRHCTAGGSGAGIGSGGGGTGSGAGETGSGGSGGGSGVVKAGDATAIAVGEDHACALLRGGRVDCWGSNGYGDLGNGTYPGPENCGAGGTCSTTPVQVSGITDATAVAAGSGDACALLSGRQIDCWGSNILGQLGDGTDTGLEGCGGSSCSATPVQVSGVTNATAVADGSAVASSADACALLDSRQVDCWGPNDSGQLGDGMSTGPDSCAPFGPCSMTPVQVSGITNATAVAIGAEEACTLLSSGQVFCWGKNYYGQLGDGTSAGPETCSSGSTPWPCSTTPVQVSGITNGAAVAVGAASACAVLDSGRVDCWGMGDDGQLGDGTSTGPEHCGVEPCSTTPVQVSGITNATTIAVGDGDACALLSSGQVDCWGASASGDLGDGTSTGPETCANGDPCSTTPVQVSGITNATTIAVGDGDACALLSSGQIDCWGENEVGQLGDGTFGAPSTTPVQVTGMP